MLGITVVLIWAAVIDAGEDGPVTPTTTSALTPVTVPPVTVPPVTVPPVTVPPEDADGASPQEPEITLEMLTVIVAAMADIDDLDAWARDCMHQNYGSDEWRVHEHCLPLSPASSTAVEEAPPPTAPADKYDAIEERLRDCGATHDTPLECCVQECQHTVHCGDHRRDNIACEAACREYPRDPSKWGQFCPPKSEETGDDAADETGENPLMCDVPIPDGSSGAGGELGQYHCQHGSDCSDDGACHCWCCEDPAACALGGEKCCCPCIHDGQYCTELDGQRYQALAKERGWRLGPGGQPVGQHLDDGSFCPCSAISCECCPGGCP